MAACMFKHCLVTHSTRCHTQHFPVKLIYSVRPQHENDMLYTRILLCRVKLGKGGMDALITLGAGDMRRTLNILQARLPVLPVRRQATCERSQNKLGKRR